MVDINLQDENGHNALLLAVVAKKNALQTVQYLLVSPQMQINLTDKYWRPALTIAVECVQTYQERYDIRKLLLEHGTDANLKDHRGDTAFTLAMSTDDQRLVAQFRISE